MRKVPRKKETKAFTEAVGRALRRAAKAARNRQDVWDADLCVGKWQGGGKETLRSGSITHQVFLTDVGGLVTSFFQILRQRSAHPFARQLRTPRVLPKLMHAV